MADIGTPRQVSQYEYYIKTIKWLFGNTIIGLSPLLFLTVMNGISRDPICTESITRIIHDGVILFVCCAVMGSIVIDFVLAGHKLKSWLNFIIIFLPLLVLSFLLLDYLLIAMNHVPKESFNLNTGVSKIVIAFSIVYCTFAKTHFFMKEDTK